jgi:hypothetical protein
MMRARFEMEEEGIRGRRDRLGSGIDILMNRDAEGEVWNMLRKEADEDD